MSIQGRRESIEKNISARLAFDQLNFVDELLYHNQKLLKTHLESTLFATKSFSQYLNGFQSEQLFILEELSKVLYSPKIALGLITKHITAENAVELSRVEETFQLKNWPKLPEYHEANTKLLLSQIYYYLLLLEIIQTDSN